MFRQAKFCLSALTQATTRRYAGHSKWANIKHDKAVKDSKRATSFAKFSKMIRIAIQEGGSTDPKMNSYLRTVIDQASRVNMPMATISNQIKKFNANDAQMKKHYFEMKTMGRIFLICEVCSDNLAGLKMLVNVAMRKASNTSFADVRHMFDEIGYVDVTKPDGTFASQAEFEEKLTEDALECDAQEVEDIDFAERSATFYCQPIDLEKVKRTLLNLGYVIHNAEHIFVPHHMHQLTEGEKKAYESLRLRLSQIDGYENCFDNIEPYKT